MSVELFKCDPIRWLLPYSRLLPLFSIAAVADFSPARSQSISTYHYDNFRTCCNDTLNAQNVPGLQLLTKVILDEQVDAQPLLATGVAIPGQGTHDVLYVATENNTLYALDATTGAILLVRNDFGPPVPRSALPGQCNNNSASVGINSTPVIDQASSAIYIVVYTCENSAPIYRLHTIDLSTLTDKVRWSMLQLHLRTDKFITSNPPSADSVRALLRLRATSTPHFQVSAT